MSAKSRDTVKRILKAATVSFAGKGFEGARMDEIADSARVNKATIYYHIGDKKALYAAVLHEVLDQQVENITRRLATADTPERKLRIFIRTVSHLIDERPHIPAIIMREIASGGKHFPDVLIHDFERIIDLLSEVLDHGRQAGAFSTANALVVHLMAMAPMAYYKKLTAILQNQDVCGDTCLYRANLSFADFAAQVERLVLKSLTPGKQMKKAPSHE